MRLNSFQTPSYMKKETFCKVPPL